MAAELKVMAAELEVLAAELEVLAARWVGEAKTSAVGAVAVDSARLWLPVGE